MKTRLNKTIYFVSEREISDEGYLTGLKFITAYFILGNKPVIVFNIELLDDSTKSSKLLVQEYLNNYKPEYSEWDITQL